MEKKLAIALDVRDKNSGLELLKELEGKELIIKIGYALFLKEGFKIIAQVKEKGFEVFLDLKLHDIPNTVYNGVLSAVEMDVDYLTLHALGGKEMLSKAVEARGSSKLKLLAVTVLTSHTDSYMEYLGSKYSLQQLAVKLAKTSVEVGIDGIVSSPFEVKKLKNSINKEFLAVTPGIRLDKNIQDDQKRVATPEFAIKEGADILVIGRPILSSKNKKETVNRILEKIENA